MFSWWNGAAGPTVVSSRRSWDRASTARSTETPAKERVVQIEVIGGTTSSGRNTALPHRRTRASSIVGPPRLPHELLSLIILMAAQDLALEAPRRDVAKNLLRLASIDHAAHALVLSTHVLPALCLSGVRQLDAFSRALASNTLDVQTLAVKVKRLHICRITPPDHANRSLYADVEETRLFERTTLLPLRTILHHCAGLDSLSTDMTARALDLRYPDDMDKRGLLRVCSTLKELVTMMSLFGGDLNERLWDLSYGARTALGSSRWANLTHLQLHGPRFRMTAHTALALCELPQLTHLALIMPWIVNANGVSLAPDVLTRHGQAVERADDAVGRHSVLQLLLSGTGHRLATLLVVCHDMDGYLGSVQKIGPWFRALQWRHQVPTTGRNEKAISTPSRTQLTLVTTTAAVLNGAGVEANFEPHPSVLSKWMLQRAREQRHWQFVDGERDAVQGVSIRVAVESWKVPVVVDTPPQTFPVAHAEGYPDASQTWSVDGHQAEMDISSDPDDFESGIDNLD